MSRQGYESNEQSNSFVSIVMIAVVMGAVAVMGIDTFMAVIFGALGSIG